MGGDHQSRSKVVPKRLLSVRGGGGAVDVRGPRLGKKGVPARSLPFF